MATLKIHILNKTLSYEIAEPNMVKEEIISTMKAKWNGLNIDVIDTEKGTGIKHTTTIFLPLKVLQENVIEINETVYPERPCDQEDGSAFKVIVGTRN